MTQQRSWSMACAVLAVHAGLLLALGSVPLTPSGMAAAPANKGLMQVILSRASAPVADAVAAPPASGAIVAPYEVSVASVVGVANAAGAAGAAGAEAIAAPPPVPLLPVLGLQEARYLLSRELSQGPQLIHDVAPDLSYLALPVGPVQSAVLRLFINEQGDIDQVTVVQSALTAEVMQAVQKAYANLKFLPGRQGEVAVKSQLKIEVRLENSIPGA